MKIVTKKLNVQLIDSSLLETKNTITKNL